MNLTCRRLLAVLAAFVLFGCANDDGSRSSTPTPTLTSTRPPTPTTATSTPTPPAATSPLDPPATAPSGPATTSPSTTSPSTTSSAVAAAADVAARPSAGCGTNISAPGETTVALADFARPGRVLDILPSADNGTVPLPLVVDLHGYQESIEIHRLMSNLSATGERYGFAIAMPQIDNEVPRWDATVGSADVMFVNQVLDRELAVHCIDMARIYVTGLSNGAFMASAVACAMSARVAAVATVAGIRDPDGCVFERPVPVIAFHGTADTFVAYEGGLGPSVANLPTDGGGTLGTGAVSTSGPSIEEIAAAWAGRNGCSSAAPTPVTIAADVTLLPFDCAPQAEVELYRIEGGGHAWPGSAFSASIASVIGPTTSSIDANELIWSFFAAHALPE